MLFSPHPMPVLHTLAPSLAPRHLETTARSADDQSMLWRQPDDPANCANRRRSVDRQSTVDLTSTTRHGCEARPCIENQGEEGRGGERRDRVTAGHRSGVW
jgi:hypothetical protein